MSTKEFVATEEALYAQEIAEVEAWFKTDRFKVIFFGYYCSPPFSHLRLPY